MVMLKQVLHAEREVKERQASKS